VTITADAGTVSATPSAGIEFTNFFEISKNDNSNLSSSTEFDVTGAGGTQSIVVHTSCSKPLNLGDRFGSVALVGLETEDEGFVGIGGTIEYQYKVTNVDLNGEDAVNVTVWDSEIGLVGSVPLLGVGDDVTFFAAQTLFQDTTNLAIVTGNVVGAEPLVACAGDLDSVTTTVPMPPMGPFDCHDAKPIDELVMTWDGTVDICVKAWDGAAGGTLLATHDNVLIGDSIAFNGMGGSPNDQEWTIYALGDCGGALLGTSRFHISCSDSSMNGVEDCGKNLGDGKDNDPTLINDWLFHGMSGELELSCEPGSNIVPTVACGFGPELVLLMPALMWLHRRRLRKAE
jgi:serine-aspartate repeat-containing protein C/D/E